MLDKECLQEYVKEYEDAGYEDLVSKITNSIISRSIRGYTDVIIDTGYSCERGDGWYEGYPIEMYEQCMKELSEDLDVRRWKFLWWNLPYWTITWKVEE